MKITKSYLEKLIREQVESVMAESVKRTYTPSLSSIRAIAGALPKNDAMAEKLGLGNDEKTLKHIMTSLHDLPDDRKLEMLERALNSSTDLQLSKTGKENVINAVKGRLTAEARLRAMANESKKSENEIILEVHRNNRKLSPAVKNNWWQND
jgi:hypothetical protein